MLKKPFRGCLSGGVFDSSMRSVLIAEVMKTLSPQTIGVELPIPGISNFHLILVSSLHLVGGVALGAVPLASGPRNWCQLSCSDICMPLAMATKAILKMMASLIFECIFVLRSRIEKFAYPSSGYIIFLCRRHVNLINGGRESMVCLIER